MQNAYFDLRRFIDFWNGLSLLARFMTLTAITTVGIMSVVGYWVESRITLAVLQTEAGTAAHFADTFVEPNVQELKSSPTLDPVSRQKLDELLLPNVVGKPIISISIWRGNTVVYSDRMHLVGKSFLPSPMRDRAWAGSVQAKFERIEDPDHRPTPGPNAGPILEVYAPVRETGTNRVIALFETYEIAPGLGEELQKSRFGSWFVVGLATLGILAIQFFIVQSGSQTIDSQNQTLTQQISRLEQLLGENQVLRTRMAQASGRVTAMHDQSLRRIGADLHDGPLQNLGVAMLRADALSQSILQSGKPMAADAAEDIGALRLGLHEAIRELRNISGGMMLPELEHLTMQEVLATAVKRHERRTGTVVRFNIGTVPSATALELKSCLYRFVQEGLSNAFRHADGKGQELEAAVDGDHIVVRVLDLGITKKLDSEDEGADHQGLIGMRDRLEAMDGTFTIETRSCGGTCVTARIPIRSKDSGGLHRA